MPNANSRPVVTVLTAADEPKPPGLEPLESQAETRYANDLASLRGALPGTDVLMVTDFRTDIFRDAWETADQLRWIHATSAGVDALMIPEVLDSDVEVTNARGIFDRGIAETVLGAILMFAKDIPQSLRLQRQHQWCHRETERVLGKRVLVVGAGSIGAEISRLTRAAGLCCTGIAREAREDPDFDRVLGNNALYDALAEADYVVVAMPLTDATRGLFDDKAFSAMPKHARLINIARGPIVQTEALVNALKEKRIAGAALDVFEEEPLPEDHPLWDLPNVLITAHMAGDFVGWRTALSEQFLENFNRWQAGQPLFNRVDKKLGYVPSQ